MNTKKKSSANNSKIYTISYLQDYYILRIFDLIEETFTLTVPNEEFKALIEFGRIDGKNVTLTTFEGFSELRIPKNSPFDDINNNQLCNIMNSFLRKNIFSVYEEYLIQNEFSSQSTKTLICPFHEIIENPSNNPNFIEYEYDSAIADKIIEIQNNYFILQINYHNFLDTFHRARNIFLEDCPQEIVNYYKDKIRYSTQSQQNSSLENNPNSSISILKQPKELNKYDITITVNDDISAIFQTKEGLHKVINKPRVLFFYLLYKENEWIKFERVKRIILSKNKDLQKSSIINRFKLLFPQSFELISKYIETTPHPKNKNHHQHRIKHDVTIQFVNDEKLTPFVK